MKYYTLQTYIMHLKGIKCLTLRTTILTGVRQASQHDISGSDVQHSIQWMTPCSPAMNHKIFERTEFTKIHVLKCPHTLNKQVYPTK